MRRWLILGAVVAAAVLMSGCKKDNPASNTDNAEKPKPRERGQLTENTSPATRPAESITGKPTGSMPHDAVHAPFRPGENMAPKFAPLAEWQPKPAREMTDQVFALPKAEGDPEDADLAISHLERHIPMQGNMARWGAMFGYQGAAVEQNAKKQELEGVSYPTTVVDISGTFKGSMMAPANPPKENYRMLVAEIRAPQRPYYVRLLGPQKTVAKWEEAYMKFVREAAK